MNQIDHDLTAFRAWFDANKNITLSETPFEGTKTLRICGEKIAVGQLVFDQNRERAGIRLLATYNAIGMFNSNRDWGRYEGSKVCTCDDMELLTSTAYELGFPEIAQRFVSQGHVCPRSNQYPGQTPINVKVKTLSEEEAQTNLMNRCNLIAHQINGASQK